MRNFEFYAPTRVLFGKGTHLQVGEVIRGYGFRKILLHYGGGSIKRTGLYDAVVKSLADSGIEFVELGGVEPNPKLSMVRRAVQVCKAEQVEMILAVGGGSVIDSAKAAAAGAKVDFDPWRFSLKEVEPEESLPVGTILTLAASGSEMSASSVITNEEGWLKRGFNSPHNRPLFSILNPELTYTVNEFQTACGTVDIMMHTLERYFTKSEPVELTDRIAEALLKSVIEAGQAAMADPGNYEARATLMWAGSLSHNDLTSVGRAFFLAVHQLEHEVSGMFDNVTHGAGLAVLFPAWAKYVYHENVLRFCQYAVRVWNCEMDYGNPEATAVDGIRRTERFFKSLGMPTRLSELGIGEKSFDELAEKCTFWGKRTIPGWVELGKQEIIDILQIAK